MHKERSPVDGMGYQSHAALSQCGPVECGGVGSEWGRRVKDSVGQMDTRSFRCVVTRPGGPILQIGPLMALKRPVHVRPDLVVDHSGYVFVAAFNLTIYPERAATKFI